MIEIQEVTNLEVAFGTTKYLADREDIPEEFWQGHTKWNKLFSHLFFDGGKDVSFKFKKGTDQSKFFRWFKAHAGSFEPSHEAKEAGVAFFMSQHLDDYKINSPKTKGH